jgi:hypothetical protein
MSQVRELPIARLAGVIEMPGEHAACAVTLLGNGLVKQ